MIQPAAIVIVDTDVFSYLFRDAPQADLYRPHLQGVIPALTFVTIGELYRGAYKQRWREQQVERLEARIKPYLKIPCEESVARMWARIQTGVPGRTFPTNDAWVAACALVYDCPVLSHNRRDFHDVPGVRLINHAAGT